MAQSDQTLESINRIEEYIITLSHQGSKVKNKKEALVFYNETTRVLPFLSIEIDKLKKACS